VLNIEPEDLENELYGFLVTVLKIDSIPSMLVSQISEFTNTLKQKYGD